MTTNIFLKHVTEMAKIDQDLRFSAVRARKSKKKAGLTLENYMIYVTDWVHGQRLKQLIQEYGYPSRKAFGEKGMASFWLLIQHQDYDVALQKRCLRSCDFSREHREYLTDRIAVNEGREQIYGTQRRSRSSPLPS